MAEIKKIKELHKEESFLKPLGGTFLIMAVIGAFICLFFGDLGKSLNQIIGLGFAGLIFSICGSTLYIVGSCNVFFKKL